MENFRVAKSTDFLSGIFCRECFSSIATPEYVVLTRS